MHLPPSQLRVQQDPGQEGLSLAQRLPAIPSEARNSWVRFDPAVSGLRPQPLRAP